ncbi:hypothetical protein CROQUDRAFT_93986 [Cronartium quercuum f. sp. fusiforme G11]|uniref:Retrotransposon gag domain-containing protein n=1 Tax=Cronartium quercuum f. sp. fusiforme G11 TaxID=708437 RepID=A0A9P6TAM2_9BASI|nr:hypothetical protein CROQUDRAFT_93986 [Cronartium quercuum f. sp. fusiforme G11]
MAPSVEATPTMNRPLEEHHVPTSLMVTRCPPLIPNLHFMGKTNNLERYLLPIRQATRNFPFKNDKDCINWAAQHFLSVDGTKSPAYKWFTGLLRQNAYEQGYHTIDKYFDLFLPPYTFTPLSSFAAFTEAVINMYGEKNPEDAGQKALDSCIQGDSPISDYNARFLDVCYGVPLTKHSHVAAYVKGLNANIMGIVNLNPAWPLAQ